MSRELERIENELKLAGYRLDFDKDEIESEDDYTQAIGNSVYELCKLFAEQGHSGMSASLTLCLLTKLLGGGTLTPLTNNPDEWECITPDHPASGGRGYTYYHSKRDSSCFSDDDLKTYYDIDEDCNREFELDENGNKTGWSCLVGKDKMVRHTLKNYEV